MPDQMPAAETLLFTPSSQEQLAAASRVTARHASSKEDLVLLLHAVGLPADDDDLTALFPLLPSSEGDPGMPEKTPASPSEIEATALSMHYAADKSMEEITEATGLSAEEITTLISNQERQFDADEAAGTSPAAPEPTAGVEDLLRWAEHHSLAGVRNQAARIRNELADFTARREEEAATREAEERVARAKSELEEAQEKLRAAKAGTRTATSSASAAAPTPIGTRSKEELAAIRTWGRANGHQVADQGRVPKAVVDAYNTAHQAPAAKAS
ncbi:histone-like nucleoid-structuring protein Lsr2 [Streptomyces sp. NPDC058595]|uniref:Lsr2 family DNA-binding protein n=1 Tax=Streptomyces sp. NPDC058595 TaxID=3346550 RepID=UPI00365B0B77